MAAIVRAACVWLLVVSSIAAADRGPLTFYRTPLRLASAPAYMGDAAPITNVHERTHWVSSELRQQYGGATKNCLYVGEGKFVILTEPRPLRIGDVAAAVRYRGRCYQLYLVEQRQYWDAEPLYLFDEWVAYSNGAGVAIERYPGASNAYTLTQALEFAHYAATVIDRAPANYDRRPLAAFWVWNSQRLIRTAERARRAGGRNWEPSAAGWLAEVRRTLPRMQRLASARR